MTIGHPERADISSPLFAHAQLLGASRSIESFGSPSVSSSVVVLPQSEAENLRGRDR